jgi:hypothetical protein
MPAATPCVPVVEEAFDHIYVKPSILVPLSASASLIHSRLTGVLWVINASLFGL